jgi:hypothetical protein
MHSTWFGLHCWLFPQWQPPLWSQPVRSCSDFPFPNASGVPHPRHAFLRGDSPPNYNLNNQ